MKSLLVLLLVIPLVISFNQDNQNSQEQVLQYFASTPSGYKHTNNWAVIVCSSRFWFNYRHLANALAIYHTVKRLGIPDSQIILSLSEDVACNPRNIYPSAVYNELEHKLNVYPDDIQVDYRGHEVDSLSLLRLLEGRHEPDVSRSKRLLTDDRSNILLYLTGHGGDGFLKFQDKEELNSKDLADAIEQMYRKGRYGSILLMVETCQASTLYKKIYSPNVIAIGSSMKGESSYSHDNDFQLGLAVSDRFTHDTLRYLENRVGRRNTNSTDQSLLRLFHSYTFASLGSHVEWWTDAYQMKPFHQVSILEFFAASVEVDLTSTAFPLDVL